MGDMVSHISNCINRNTIFGRWSDKHALVHVAHKLVNETITITEHLEASTDSNNYNYKKFINEQQSQKRTCPTWRNTPHLFLLHSWLKVRKWKRKKKPIYFLLSFLSTTFFMCWLYIYIKMIYVYASPMTIVALSPCLILQLIYDQNKSLIIKSHLEKIIHSNCHRIRPLQVLHNIKSFKCKYNTSSMQFFRDQCYPWKMITPYW